MRCYAYCPAKAIKAGYSWIMIMMLVSSTAVGGFLLAKTAQVIPFLNNIENKALLLVAYLIYYYTFIILAHKVFQMALKVPFINTIFKFTTITPLFKRYNEQKLRLLTNN